MRISIIHVFVTLIILSAGSAPAVGQDTAWWPLTANATPIVRGNVTANNFRFSSGLSTGGGGLGYSIASGIGTKGWVSAYSLSNTDTTAFYEFAVRPKPGYSLLINEIQSTSKLNYDTSNGCADDPDIPCGVSVLIRYSYDSVNFFSTYQQPIVFLLYRQDSVFFNWFNLNIPVSSGKTVYFRMFAYNVASNKGVFCKNFKVIGSTGPCTSPNASNFSVLSASNACYNADSSTVTVSSSTLPNGSYIITYDLAGANPGLGFTSTMSIASGTGTFKVPKGLLTNLGITQVKVTRVGVTASCYSSITTSNTTTFTVLAGIPSPPASVAGQDSLCAYASGNVFQISAVTNATSYVWTVPAGWTITAGAGTTGITATAGSNLQSGNVQVSASNGCGTSSPAIKPVYLKQLPLLSSSTSIPRCSNTAYTYTATADMPGTVFSWTRASIGGISNGPASGSGNVITETLNNTSANTVNATYIITMLNNGCTRVQNVTAPVYPTPSLNSATSSSVCSGTPFNYTCISATTGVSFSWSRAAVAGVNNGASSGTGASISETLTSTSPAGVVVTYEITMTANGCSNVQNLLVTVNPAPSLTSSTFQTRCPGIAGTYNITSTPSGATYTWTRAAIGGNVAASGSGSSITETLGNNTTGAINAIYVITMSNGGCNIVARDTVQVSALPAILVQPSGSTVCTDSTARFQALAGGTGLTYQWQVSTNGGSSYGNVTGGTGATTTSYTITGVLSTMNNNLYKLVVTGACGSVSSNAVLLTVPSVIVNNVTSSQTICNNTAPSIFTGIPSGGNGSYTFIWERSTSSPTTGYSAAAGTNNTENYSSAALSISPSVYYFRRRISSGGCAKNSNVIQINLTSGITAGSNTITANQTICQNATPSSLTGSSPSGGAGAGSYLYRWERSETGPSQDYDSIAGSQSYAPRSMLETAWFRRVVTSGGCKDTSAAIAVTVVIPNASLVPDTVQICTGQITPLLARSSTTMNAQDFSDNARGWSQANALNSGGLTAPNSVNNGSGNSNDWVRYPNLSTFLGNTFQSPDNSDFLMTQSNRIGETTSTALYSPVLNTTGYAYVYLRYAMSFKYISSPDAGYVEVSTNNVSWTVVKTYSATRGASNSFVNEKVDISAYANLPVLYVRFRYYGQYGGWWAMDNLIIEGISSTPAANVWNPATYLYTDAAATVPYVAGTSTSTVYAKPSVQTTYSVGAAGCYSLNTSTVKVSPTIGTATVTGGGTFCNSATLNATTSITGTLYFQGTNSSGTSTTDPATSKLVSASGTYFFRAQAASGCWTSADSAVVVINTPPSISAQPVAQSICVGGNDTLRVQAGGTGVSYQWQVSSDGGSSWSNLSDNASYGGTATNALRVLNTQTTSFPLTYKVVISSGVACGSAVTSVPLALKFRNLWTGAVSTSWSDPANWSDNSLPSLTCNDMYITGGRPFQPTLTSTGSVKNIHVISGGLLTINGGTLKIAGTIESSSAIDARAGTVEFNGSGSAQNIAGSNFVQKKLFNLIVNNSSGLILTNVIGDTLKLSGRLNFGNVNSSFTTNNNLYLLADSLGAGSVADLTNGGVNNNSVIGDVTIENYISRGRKWRFLSIPNNTTQSFRQSWQENNGATVNSRPGFGTMITDNNSSTYAANGFDYYTGGGPSVKKYNVATTLYDAIPSTSAAINTAGGYMVYIRGDRSATPSNTVVSPTILRTKGPLKQGTQASVNVPASTVVDIGNPYASPVSMGSIQKPGVQDVFYIWDPRLGGSYGLGGFQTFTNIGGRYYPTPGSGSYPDTASFSMIQAGQAFFVRGSTGGSVTMKETDKGTGFRQVFRTAGLPSLMRISLYEMSNGNFELADGAAVDFDYAFNNGIDFDDAVKLPNPGLAVGILRDSQLLSVEKRKPVISRDTVFISFTGAGIRNYRWDINLSNMDTAGRIAYLQDQYLNSSTVLNLDGSNQVGFSVDASPASRYSGRFMIVFVQTAALPVRLLELHAVRAGRRLADISWKSENEEAVDHYELERSTDGRNFPVTVTIRHAVNNGGSVKYFETDGDAPDGIIYYRVKAVDRSGQSRYSSIVKLLPLPQPQNIFSVYPNPVQGRIVHLKMAKQAAGVYDISLSNTQQQVIFRQYARIGADESSRDLELPGGIPSGTYTLSVLCPDGSRVQLKIIVRH